MQFKWSIIWLVPIPRTLKDPDFLPSYHTIALMNVFVKLLNSVIKVRINKFIEEYKILPANCYAYSPQKSTSSCRNDILLHIPIAKSKGSTGVGCAA